MEPVFIAAVIMAGALVTTSYFVTNGVGLWVPKRISPIPMNKAPVGLVDLFKDNRAAVELDEVWGVWFLLLL